MKKIINTPETVVIEMCEGIAKARPSLEFLAKHKIVKRREIDKNKVTLISGGGSGHEPAHAGFVGYGMLDAAVCGDVFASPSSVQVYSAIKAVKSDKGTLLIVKNYSGDRMNFDTAKEDATDDDIKVDSVYVNDDIAVKDSLYTIGRRGVAGTVFVHKIAGAKAEQGADLEAVKAAANKAIANIGSIGFALTSCTVPAKGTPTFAIGEDEMEYGVGIHGEPGIARRPVETADNLAKEMIDALIKDMKIADGGKIAVMVNGFGGSPLQELYLFFNSVTKFLPENIEIYRAYVGNYMTSIDMAGASLTFFKLDDELISLLDFKADTAALVQ
jgi:dihydroxyacetone kinase